MTIEENNNQSGPEFAPLKDFIKTFKIRVEVFDKDDNIVRTEVMDYGKYQDKVWLGRLSFWAWNNNYTVETSADK